MSKYETEEIEVLGRLCATPHATIRDHRRLAALRRRVELERINRDVSKGRKIRDALGLMP